MENKNLSKGWWLGVLFGFIMSLFFLGGSYLGAETTDGNYINNFLLSVGEPFVFPIYFPLAIIMYGLQLGDSFIVFYSIILALGCSIFYGVIGTGISYLISKFSRKIIFVVVGLVIIIILGSTIMGLQKSYKSYKSDRLRSCKEKFGLKDNRSVISDPQQAILQKQKHPEWNVYSKEEYEIISKQVQTCAGF